MKLNAIQHVLLLSLLPTTSAFAAALDRSGQSIAPFLQAGNYFEAGISVLDPNVSGKDTSKNDTGNMAANYYSPNAALKLQATEKFSIGLIYDQPYGAPRSPSRFSFSVSRRHHQSQLYASPSVIVVVFSPWATSLFIIKCVNCIVSLSGLSYSFVHLFVHLLLVFFRLISLGCLSFFFK